jgi:hypothetical protein
MVGSGPVLRGCALCPGVTNSSSAIRCMPSPCIKGVGSLRVLGSLTAEDEPAWGGEIPPLRYGGILPPYGLNRAAGAEAPKTKSAVARRGLVFPALGKGRMTSCWQMSSLALSGERSSVQVDTP